MSQNRYSNFNVILNSGIPTNSSPIPMFLFARQQGMRFASDMLCPVHTNAKKLRSANRTAKLTFDGKQGRNRLQGTADCCPARFFQQKRPPESIRMAKIRYVLYASITWIRLTVSNIRLQSQPDFIQHP